MRKLILKMDVSLDGFVGGPNAESDWIFETCDEGCTTWVLETIAQAGLHVTGRKSFETMASYWRAPAQDLKAANADDERRKAQRASPEAAKQNQKSWREPLIATDLVADITRQKALRRPKPKLRASCSAPRLV
jgi:dihydrofolate reductase